MGETGTLIEDDGTGVPFKIKFSDSSTKWFAAENVALAGSRPRVGESVRIIGGEHRMGETGTLIEYPVRMAGSGMSAARRLEARTPVTEPGGLSTAEAMVGRAAGAAAGAFVRNAALDMAAEHLGLEALGAAVEDAVLETVGEHLALEAVGAAGAAVGAAGAAVGAAVGGAVIEVVAEHLALEAVGYAAASVLCTMM
jgi:hypothetical protein